MLKRRRRSRLVWAEKDLEWNGMECSGIRLKNFFLRLNPPLAVKVNCKHRVGSLGFLFSSRGVLHAPRYPPQYPAPRRIWTEQYPFDVEGAVPSIFAGPTLESCVSHCTWEQHATATSYNHQSRKNLTIFRVGKRFWFVSIVCIVCVKMVLFILAFVEFDWIVYICKPW